VRNSLLGGQSIACMVRVATTLFSNVWNNRRQGQETAASAAGSGGRTPKSPWRGF